MAKFIRYALASVFFAASVGCLALWWRSLSTGHQFLGPNYFRSPQAIYVEFFGGVVIMQTIEHSGRPLDGFDEAIRMWPSLLEMEDRGSFGIVGDIIYFPLWYPALIFAIAGVGVLRFRRQFSMRSALIAVTVVAALLGMVVAL